MEWSGIKMEGLKKGTEEYDEARRKIGQKIEEYYRSSAQMIVASDAGVAPQPDSGEYKKGSVGVALKRPETNESMLLCQTLGWLIGEYQDSYLSELISITG